jgi:hypothetical protein
MITYDRLSQIIPSDQALANKALATSLQQLTGISRLNLTKLSTAAIAVQSVSDLPIINSLTEAVPASVANYYSSTLALGTGPNDTIRITDVIGLAAGWVATDAYTEIVSIFSTMDLTTLTGIYQRMANVMNGTYGDPTNGPIVIPAGVGAGTYTAVTTPNPTPPPTDIVVTPAYVSAMAALTTPAQTEINALIVKYPNQTTRLNTLTTNIAVQVQGEKTLQPIVGLNYADLQSNNSNSIMAFVTNLPTFGTEDEVGGLAEFLQNVADTTTQAGQAVVGCLRQGRNQKVLASAGIGTNLNIPDVPNTPAEKANL